MQEDNCAVETELSKSSEGLAGIEQTLNEANISNKSVPDCYGSEETLGETEASAPCWQTYPLDPSPFYNTRSYIPHTLFILLLIENVGTI